MKSNVHSLSPSDLQLLSTKVDIMYKSHLQSQEALQRSLKLLQANIHAKRGLLLNLTSFVGAFSIVSAVLMFYGLSTWDSSASLPLRFASQPEQHANSETYKELRDAVNQLQNQFDLAVAKDGGEEPPGPPGSGSCMVRGLIYGAGALLCLFAAVYLFKEVMPASWA